MSTANPPLHPRPGPTPLAMCLSEPLLGLRVEVNPEYRIKEREDDVDGQPTITPPPRSKFLGHVHPDPKP